MYREIKIWVTINNVSVYGENGEYFNFKTQSSTKKRRVKSFENWQ